MAILGDCEVATAGPAPAVPSSMSGLRLSEKFSRLLRLFAEKVIGCSGLIKPAHLVFIPISDFLVMAPRPNYFVVVGFIKMRFQPPSHEFRRSQLSKMAAGEND